MAAADNDALTAQRPAGTPRASGRARDWLIIGAGAVLAAAGIGASLAADVPAGARARYAVLNALVILVPIAVGVYATQRAAHRRFGRLLILAGLVWSSAALAQADSSLAYSVGRIGGWIVTAVLVLLILSYPTGALRGRVDRGLGAASVAILCILYLPTALLIDAYPLQTPWSACRTDCPANAFMVAQAQPAFVDDVVSPLRDVLLLLVIVAVMASLTVRVRAATRPGRHMLVPVLAVGLLQLLLLIVFVAARRAEPDRDVGTLGWLYALCVPAVALAFLAGLVSWRLYTARALRRVAVESRGRLADRELRDLLADALECPGLRMAWRRGGHWVDENGEPAQPFPARPGEALTALRGDGELLAVMAYDHTLADDPEFVSAVAACAVSALEHDRLQARVAAALQTIEHSRAQGLAVADDERRRMEHDLHDGAQQRLVGLAIRLELEREMLPGDRADVLKGLATEVEHILEEIRSLSRGVHPSLLRDRGLDAALRAAAAHSPLPTSVEAADVGRHPPEVETAVYYTCLEALQNALKHARSATGVWITVRDEGAALVLEVRDDGAGFDPRGLPPAVGLSGMRKRMAAIGGTLDVLSSPGAGTRVIGRAPHPPVRPLPSAAG